MSDNTPSPSDDTVDQATPSPQPTPRPAAPSPAAMAKMAPRRPTPAAAPAPVTSDHSASAEFGRVGEDGTVYVREGDGERAVGSYPGADAAEALQYFARKYDELYASAVLLRRRLDAPEVSAKEVADGLSSLKAHTEKPDVVGDLAALSALVTEVETGVAAHRERERAERAEAKKVAAAEREGIVEQAEAVAAQPEDQIRWKDSTARMRELLEQWKTHQKAGVRLDKDVENALWQRFSKARNSFDKGRRAHFSELEATRGESKGRKEELVAEAERLATSTDWGPTAGAFKRLMQEWRRAGRAGRKDDDALWERFRTAQDSFFSAKDAEQEREDESYRPNLEVKEKLLTEAKALLPIKDLDATKAALRSIQQRWEDAGKVPRGDVDRMEKGLRSVEQAVRDAEDTRWTRSDPEKSARANSLVAQLEAKVTELEAQIEAATDDRRRARLQEQLDSTQGLLAMARAGADDLGG
ncbi:DUF349 domain-containing protein [Marihabitans asiaticum]|uniref:Uncharacterized protein DUF349 n=1 Tax=Marihabitans asiaticum TaxID=415218 RepID=A0A560W705_9MICO|nr:DUF349 domain-containing protein [Marihabitans asiaticum]TWD13285.1 uncharacterized protein DUF349 [Marihabitans asiaticum]